MSWWEEARLELSVDKALEDCSERLNLLSGKDKKCLQEEFLEWMVTDFDDLEIQWMQYFGNWGE